MSVSWLAAGTVGLALAAVGQAAPQYQFTLDAGQSTANLTLTVKAQTSGTLVGNYDPTATPVGTRTKPGLFGSFGTTENVTVPVTLNPTMTGPLAAPVAGAFALGLDPGAGTATLTGLSLDLLPQPAITLPTSAAVGLNAFRTRTPDSTYPSANTAMPMDSATVSELTGQQTADPAVGTLTQVAPDHFQFTATPLVAFTAQVLFSGNALSPATAAVPVTLVGDVMLAGDSAALTATINLSFSDTAAPNQVLPPLPYALPTVLPAGATANVIFNLTLTQTTTQATGPMSLAGAGVAVPEPATLAALLAGLGWVGRRPGRRP